MGTVVRREGWIFLFRKAYLRFINVFVDYKCYFIFNKKLEGICHRQDPVQGAKLSIVDSVEKLHELERADYDFSTMTTIDKLSDGIKGGGILFALFIDKDLAHTSWVALDTRAAAYDWIFQRVNYPGSAYIGPCDTPEKFRGLGLYPYTLTQIFNFLVNMGVSRAVINTRMTNAPSIKGILKAGFSLMSKAHFIKFGRHEYFWEQHI